MRSTRHTPWFVLGLVLGLSVGCGNSDTQVLDGGMTDGGMELAGQLYITHEAAASGEHAPVLEPRHRLPDVTRIRHLAIVAQLSHYPGTEN